MDIPEEPPPSRVRRGSMVETQEKDAHGRMQTVKTLESYDAASERRHEDGGVSYEDSVVLSCLEEDADDGYVEGMDLGPRPDAKTLACLMTSPGPRGRSRGNDDATMSASMMPWGSSMSPISWSAERRVTFEGSDDNSTTGYAPSNSTTTFMMTGLEEQFPVGSYVIARRELRYGDIIVPAGSYGIIAAHVPLMGVDWQGFASLTNAVVYSEHLEAPPSYPVISGIDTALWHDESYKFSSRFVARSTDAARAAQPQQVFLKPTAWQQPPPSIVPKLPTTVLKEMVCDHPSSDIDEEIRPHMKQFWLDTAFKSEENRLPEWHPGSTKSSEEKDQMLRVLRNYENPKFKKSKHRMIQPLVQPPYRGGVTRGSALSVSGRLQSPANRSDSGSFTFGTRPAMPEIDHSDLVGLTHPEQFGGIDDALRFSALAGPQQQSLYGWNSPAGPRYVPEEPPADAVTTEEAKEKGKGLAGYQTGAD